MLEFPHSPAEQSAGLLSSCHRASVITGDGALARYAFFAVTGTGTPATFRLTENRLLRLVK